MSSQNDDDSSQSSLFSSASSKKINHQFETNLKSKFQIDEEIQELEEEESAYIPIQRLYSSSSSSDDSLQERLALNKRKFQHEIKQLKESVVNSSEEKSRSNFKRIPPNLYESAKSDIHQSSSQRRYPLPQDLVFARMNGTPLADSLDLSETFNEIKQSFKPRDQGIEYRIKKLEKELQDTIKSKQSDSKSSQSRIFESSVVSKFGNSEKVDRKINFEFPDKFEQLDQETQFINNQIEKIKKQVETENRIESDKRKRLKKVIQNSKKQVIQTSDSKENISSEQSSQIKQMEKHLLQEIDKLRYNYNFTPRQDNDSLRNMIKKTPSNEQINQGSQSKTLQKVIKNNNLSKLDKEIEILKQVDRIRVKLKKSIARKLSIDETKNVDYKAELSQNTKKHKQNASYLLHKGIPTTYLDN